MSHQSYTSCEGNEWNVKHKVPLQACRFCFLHFGSNIIAIKFEFAKAKAASNAAEFFFFIIGYNE